MTTTINQSYQLNPVGVASGGTGNSSLTAYSLLAGGTTSTGALQNAGTGTSGQVYVSGGNAVLGTWTDAKKATAMQWLASTAASSSASIAFTGLSSTYYAYRIVAQTVIGSGTQQLSLRFSSDNGVTYYSSTGNYSYAGVDLIAATTISTLISASSTSIVLTASTATTSVAAIDIMIINPSVAIQYNGIYWQSVCQTSSSVYGCGNLNVNTAVNAVEIVPTAGTIASGTFTLYGLLA